MEYLLSVVIPSRNRQIYALQSVQQIYAVTDESVQIVVQDNSDDDSLAAMLEKENFGPRVKYTFIATRIPGVDNYAGGIAASDGEYVCCIGDDDGVLRGIVDVVKWAKENHIAAVKPGVQASYFWPGTMPSFPEGCLNLEYTDASYYYANPQQELERFLKSGALDFPNAKLVKAYHGIVRKDMFQKIYDKTGRYCGGLSPDIYLSTSLSLDTDSLLCLNFPLTIFGACKQSTTGDSVNKVNVSKLELAPHFVGQPYTWSEKVPEYYCGMNIWADSAMHALDDMGAEDMKKLFYVEKLTCMCLLNHRAYKKEIMENFRRNNCDKQLLRKEMRQTYPGFMKKKIKETFRNIKPVAKIYRAIRDKRQAQVNEKVFTTAGIADIKTAEEIITATLQPAIDKFLDTMKNTKGGTDGK